jgi:RNA polymerase sigma-70 factor, ECF subfamily
MSRLRPVASSSTSGAADQLADRPVLHPRPGLAQPRAPAHGPRPRTAPESGPLPVRPRLVAPPPAAAPGPTAPAAAPTDTGRRVTAAGRAEHGPEHVPVWELVRRAQGGDAEGFGLLYDRYVDVVFRFLLHRVGDRATAEDFTSETFVRALRRIDSLSFQGRDVGAWLVTIARNILLDHVKSSRFRLEVATADMRDADRATAGPEEAVLQSLTNAELLTVVQQLSEDQRECVVLRFLQGLSVAETAAAMGKKDGAIKALQHRAVRRLGTLLSDGLH